MYGYFVTFENYYVSYLHGSVEHIKASGVLIVVIKPTNIPKLSARAIIPSL